MVAAHDGQITEEDVLDQLFRGALEGDRTRVSPPADLWPRVRQLALARRLAAHAQPAGGLCDGSIAETKRRAAGQPGLSLGPDR